MAFGFPAYHQEDVTFPFPVTHEWIVYACQMAGLGAARWGQGRNGGMWHVSPGVSLTSWGETMTIAPLAPNVVRIRSECGLPHAVHRLGKERAQREKARADPVGRSPANTAAPFSLTEISATTPRRHDAKEKGPGGGA